VILPFTVDPQTVLSALGVVGSGCALLMYWLLEQGKITAKTPIFYSVNALGSILVLCSTGSRYDSGDLGTLILESVWTIISIMGLIKALRKP
jgi:hypothetical protein